MIQVLTIFSILYCYGNFNFPKVSLRYVFTDVTIPPWPDETTAEGHKERMLNYTITSTFSFGPKHVISTEKQVRLNESF